MSHLQFFFICLADWVNRNQQSVIEYLQKEVKILREQLGKPICPEAPLADAPRHPLMLDFICWTKGLG